MAKEPIGGKWEVDDNDVKLAEIKKASYSEQVGLWRENARNRTLLCFAMIVAGLLTVVAGVVLIKYGADNNGATIRILALTFDSRGFGGLILLAGLGWGYLAYLTRPENMPSLTL